MKRVLLISFAISGVLGALFFLVVLPNLRPSDAPLARIHRSDGRWG